MTRNVVVLGVPGEEHATHVEHLLKSRCVQVEFLHSSLFPKTLKMNIQNPPQLGKIAFPSGTTWSFQEIHSFYWRNFCDINPDAANSLFDMEQLYIAQNDSRSLLESFLIDAPGKWVNGWTGFQLHQRKPAALNLACQNGATVPKTLYTNDPKAILDFMHPEKEYIFKPIQGGAYTRSILKSNLTESRLKRLSIAPVTIQEKITGTNIRVFRAGDWIEACEIHTAELDFREDRSVSMSRVALPEHFRQLCKNISNALHLSWTGMDFIRDSSGTYYFLEANPSPMFIGFERLTGLPIGERLIDHILS